MKKLTPLDSAYFAGVVDKGASLYLLRKKYLCVQIRDHGKLPEMMHKTFGGSFAIARITTPQGLKLKPMPIWRLYGALAFEFLTQVIPFLRDRKKRQRAKMVLRIYHKSYIDKPTRG